MSRAAVLVVDDESLLSSAVATALTRKGHSVRTVGTIAEAVAAVQETTFDVIVLDQQLPDGTGVSLCPDLLKANEQSKIIFVTGFPSYRHAVEALRAGAWDYLSKPFELEELVRSVQRATTTQRLEKVERLSALKAEAAGAAELTREPGLAAVWALVEAAAATDAPVLITGETGTGKNRLARAIHAASPRRQGQWVSLNCTALPENLIEAELFGWERGAFTGATGAREGLFELAQGGTLLLDEIGAMPSGLQAKLLSVLEDREVRRLGGRSTRAIDVRILAATNAELDAQVKDGRFRADLFYRLNVVRVDLPPLRARPQDLPLICADLLSRLARGRPVSLAPGELERLAAYPWPGNVRELRNVLERALIVGGDVLRPSAFLGPVEPAPVRPSPAASTPDDDLNLARAERRLIDRALVLHDGNLTASARALGVSLSTLKRRLKEDQAEPVQDEPVGAG